MKKTTSKLKKRILSIKSKKSKSVKNNHKSNDISDTLDNSDAIISKINKFDQHLSQELKQLAYNQFLSAEYQKKQHKKYKPKVVNNKVLSTIFPTTLMKLQHFEKKNKKDILPSIETQDNFNYLQKQDDINLDNKSLEIIPPLYDSLSFVSPFKRDILNYVQKEVEHFFYTFIKTKDPNLYYEYAESMFGIHQDSCHRLDWIFIRFQKAIEFLTLQERLPTYLESESNFIKYLSSKFNFKYNKPKPNVELIKKLGFYNKDKPNAIFTDPEPNEKYAYILEVKFNTNLYDSKSGKRGYLDSKDYQQLKPGANTLSFYIFNHLVDRKICLVKLFESSFDYDYKLNPIGHQDISDN